jgi:hypothetical protein
MPNCELKVEYEGRIVTVPVGLNFLRAFGITCRNKLYCAKFLEPIPFHDELVSIVHFTDFDLGTYNITFYTTTIGFRIDIPLDFQHINLKIITPGKNIYILLLFITSFFQVAVPQIQPLTIEINSAKDLIFSHIFFLPHSKNSIEDLEYIDTISSKWGDLRNVLKSTLTDAKKKLYGMSVGIMGEADILPELKPVSHFFDDISGTKNIMIIIVSSFNFSKFDDFHYSLTCF